MEKFNPQYLVEARKVASAAGDVWNQIEDEQRPLVKALTGASTRFAAGTGINEAARWAASGRMRPVMETAFKIDPFGVTLRGAEKWGFFASGALDTSSFLGDPPLLMNSTGEVRNLLTEGGHKVKLTPGSAFDADPDDDLMTLRVNGRVTYLPGGVELPDPESGASGLLGLFGGSKVYKLREDRLPRPDGYEGVTPAHEAAEVIPGTGIIEESRAPLTDGDGHLVYDEDGKPYLDPKESEETDLYLVLSPVAMWVVSNPTGWKPASLETAAGVLMEGVGFLNGEDCIHVFQDPKTLWPDSVCKMKAASYVGRHPRSYQLRADLKPGLGKHLSAYRRRSQSLPLFFRACCDVVGLEVSDKDRVVTRIERHGNNILMTFDDNHTSVFEGPTTRSVGDMVRKDESIGGALYYRSKATHGAGWYRNRPWGLIGIQAKTFWPWASQDITIFDKPGWARCYADPIGGALRAKIQLYGEQAKIDEVWEIQAAGERASGRNWAADTFGFVTAGQEVIINPLDVVFSIAGDWAAAIEGPLGSTSPKRWRTLKSFIEEAKPAGSVMFPGPTYFL